MCVSVGVGRDSCSWGETEWEEKNGTQKTQMRADERESACAGLTPASAANSDCQWALTRHRGHGPFAFICVHSRFLRFFLLQAAAAMACATAGRSQPNLAARCAERRSGDPGAKPRSVR
jgi:hypothetical protein